MPIRSDGYSDLDPAPPSDFYDSSTAIDLLMIRPVYDEALIPMYKERCRCPGRGDHVANCGVGGVLSGNSGHSGNSFTVVEVQRGNYPRSRDRTASPYGQLVPTVL